MYKYVPLTVSQKLEIITALESNESQTGITISHNNGSSPVTQSNRRIIYDHLHQGLK